MGPKLGFHKKFCCLEESLVEFHLRFLQNVFITLRTYLIMVESFFLQFNNSFFAFEKLSEILSRSKLKVISFYKLVLPNNFFFLLDLGTCKNNERS